jgi:hypothetical protein
LKEFSRELQRELRKNGGFILNGFGRPLAVHSDYEQDCLSRYCQSTGHDALIKYATILSRLLDGAEIPWRPVIFDFHDAVTVAVPEEFEKQVVGIFNEAMRQLNQELQGTITLRGTAVVGRNLAEVKEPEN